MKNYNAQIKSNNFNQLFIKSINEIYNNGKWTGPRGFKCKEILSPQLILTNPKRSLCTIKDRKLNYAYLIIEKFMYLSQVQYPEILIHYNKGMKNYFNEDTRLFDGAYGPRIAKNNQLDFCYNTLKNDKDSRQAVISIHDYTDKHKSKDVVCTLSLQFLIRDGKLDMIANMRSNDLLWGTCLDIPAFCFFQEILAFWLGIKVGVYIHQPASLHYYDNFEETLLKLLKDKEQSELEIENHNVINDEETPRWDIKREDFDEALQTFWISEKKIRKYLKLEYTDFDCINEYLDKLYTFNYTRKEKIIRDNY